jgi:hypothetical protein
VRACLAHGGTGRGRGGGCGAAAGHSRLRAPWMGWELNTSCLVNGIIAFGRLLY